MCACLLLSFAFFNSQQSIFLPSIFTLHRREIVIFFNALLKLVYVASSTSARSRPCKGQTGTGLSWAGQGGTANLGSTQGPTQT